VASSEEVRLALAARARKVLSADAMAPGGWQLQSY
jgi:hypothetical protein